MIISDFPPDFKCMSIRVEPASIEFSTSSFITEAGRSITSPAAIWFTRFDGKTLMDIFISLYSFF